MFLTYKYCLLPNKHQHAALRVILESQRQLYNAALQERIDCYQKTGKSRSYFDQSKELTDCRNDCDLAEMAAFPVKLQRWTLERLDGAYKAFFRRLKAHNGKAGFPRFRGKGWWRSFGFSEFKSIQFDGKHLRFKGMPGGLRVHLHRPIPNYAEIKSCVFNLDHKGWNVCFQVKLPMMEKRAVSTAVGIDLGLKVFAYQSDGVMIPNPRIARRAEREMRIRQRALARCKRGSKRRIKVKQQLASLHTKITNTRTTWLHQQSALFIKCYDLVAVEDLNVQGMLKHPKFARSIADASWSKFLGFLDYKAEKAGGYLIRVDPRNTSQKCSSCGELVPKSLAVRTHSCPSCGLVIDRDWNASRNILSAVVSGGERNVVHLGKRALRNLTLVTK